MSEPVVELQRPRSQMSYPYEDETPFGEDMEVSQTVRHFHTLCFYIYEPLLRLVFSEVPNHTRLGKTYGECTLHYPILHHSVLASLRRYTRFRAFIRLVLLVPIVV